MDFVLLFVIVLQFWTLDNCLFFGKKNLPSNNLLGRGQRVGSNTDEKNHGGVSHMTPLWSGDESNDSSLDILVLKHLVACV